jgi:hypothetical protein
MTAAVRTIRKLDGLPEIKTVRGVKIEQGIPIPGTHANYGKWKKVLMAMEVGESFFDVKRRKLDGKDKIPGRDYTTRRVSGGFRVWRTK